MWLMFLFACGEDSCEVETREVADDEALDDLDYTAADVLDVVTASHVFVGSSDSVDEAEVTLTVTRGEGSAVFDDATQITRLDADDVNPFYTDYELQAACFDEVAVPVELRVEIPYIGIDVGFSTVARPIGAGALGEVWMSGSVPADTPGLSPAPLNGDRASFHAVVVEGQVLEFRLQWVDAGNSWDQLILAKN